MKKILALALSVLLVLSIFVGCTDKTDTPVNKGDSSNNSNAEIGKFEELPEEKKLKKGTDKANATVSKKEHTVLIYMVGSNLESDPAPYGSAASRDILEITEAGIDASKTNVVIYAGGAYSWTLGLPSQCNSVIALDVTGTNFDIVATTEQNVNMSTPETLCDFLTFAYENYPAESYSIIFWDHGGGSVEGFGVDDFYKNDRMFLSEFDLAFKNSPFNNQKFKFAGFDACLMATYETALVFSKYADIFVASEETEPGCGWDYSSLSTLNTSDEMAFAEKVLSTYETSMRKMTSKPDYTLSIMDLTKIADFTTAFDGFFNAVKQSVIDGNYSQVAQARQKSLTFANSVISKLDESRDLVDLGDFATKLEGLCANEASALKTAMKSFVVRQVTNMKGATGVSLYYPYYNKDSYNNMYSTIYTTVPGIDNYRNCLDVYCDMWLDGKFDTEWAKETNIETPQEASAEYLYIQLDADKMKNVGRVYYNVFERVGDNAFSPILLECQVEADASGKYMIPVDAEVVTLKTDLDSKPVIFQVNKTTEDTYVSQLAVLLAGDNLLSGFIKPVQISLKRDGNALSVMNIISRNNDDTVSFRSEVDPSYWNTLVYYTYQMSPKNDQNGLLEKYENWTRVTDEAYLIGSHYENEFNFEITKLSQLEGEYYVQVMMEDGSGNTILSAFEPLINAGNLTVEKVATEKGEMTFNVYGDYAELTLYSGEDETVTVPETAGGKPVTIIGENAFFKASTVKTIVLPQSIKTIEEKATNGVEVINLPEGLTYLGDYALSGYKGAEITLPNSLEYIGYKCFVSSKLEKITIPAQVKTIGNAAFGYASNLKEINVSGNSNYLSVGGVLFSADKKTLVAYPCGGENSYTIPNGVEKIGYGAFYGDYNFESVVIPEGVKEIDNFAFYDCGAIKELKLPESLEIIGNSAFGTDIGMPKTEATKKIEIGSKVMFIGVDAFSAFNISEYVVDTNNIDYSSIDGCLLNASGTKLIAVPYLKEGVFEVPYGVSYLAEHSLQDCNSITEIVIPDSVVAIDSAAYTGTLYGVKKITVGKALMVWDGIEKIQGVEFVISQENPYFKVEGGKVVNKQTN